MKQPYEKPRIICTETLEGSAITGCLKNADIAGCGGAIMT